MEEDLYDEFGNYIGPEQEDEEEQLDSELFSNLQAEPRGAEQESADIPTDALMLASEGFKMNLTC